MREMFSYNYIVADSVPESKVQCFFTPGSGMEKIRIGLHIPDHFSPSLVTIFYVKNTCFVADPYPGSTALLTLDPGMKKFGSRIKIPVPQHGVIITCILYSYLKICGF
jgi:hypothetical protein